MIEVKTAESNTIKKENISVFDMFKIGVGPSSSHTLGPWRASQKFLQVLESKDVLDKVNSLSILLYGSLAKTGTGHGTDIAILLGLSGYDPITISTDAIPGIIREIEDTRLICLNWVKAINFSARENITFLYNQSLPFHPNAMTFIGNLNDGGQIVGTYYSIGGGFIVSENLQNEDPMPEVDVSLPFPINSASELLYYCESTSKPISSIVLENEKQWKDEESVREDLLAISKVMQESIYKGCHTEGILPGGLSVQRRAARINNELLKGGDLIHTMNGLRLLERRVGVSTILLIGLVVLP